MAFHSSARQQRLTALLAFVVCAVAVLWGALRERPKACAHVRAPAAEAANPTLPQLRTPLRSAAAPSQRHVDSAAVSTAAALPAEVTAPATAASERVSGRVVDALGGAVAGALVSGLHAASSSPFATTSTAADGSFELRAPPGPLQILAAAEGYATERRSAVAPAGGLMLSLAPASRIFGRVVDVAGAPLSNAVVRARALWRADPSRPRSWRTAPVPFSSKPSGRASTS